MTERVPWPVAEPRWLEAWLIWRLRFALPGERPPTSPERIPEWAWCVLLWVKWRRAGGQPAARPSCAPVTIEPWAWPMLGRVNKALVVAPVAPPRRAFVMVAEKFSAFTWEGAEGLLAKMLDVAPAPRWGVFVQWGHGLDDGARYLASGGIETRLWGSCSQVDLGALKDELSAVKPSRPVIQIEGPGEYADAQRAVGDGVFYGYPVECVISGWGDFSPPGLPICSRTWIESYYLDSPGHANLPVHLGDASAHGWPGCTPLVETKRDTADSPLSLYTGIEQWRELAFWRDPVDWTAVRDWLALP